MKRIMLLALVSLLSFNICYALQITSDANGPVTLSEPQLQIGQQAPAVALTAPNFKAVTVGGATGKVQIISTIESFYTPVCDQQTMILNKAAKQLKGAMISIITTNQPFIIAAYQAKHPAKNIQLLSAFANPKFGEKYGVQVVGGELKGLTARAVFVVNQQGNIVYKQITHNIDKMPNMQAAIAAAKKALNS